MKYLKFFEVYIQPPTALKYEIDDYIIMNKQFGNKIQRIGKIINLGNNIYKIEFLLYGLYNQLELVTLWKNEHKIKRLATELEIKQFELQKNIITYNL